MEFNFKNFIKSTSIYGALGMLPYASKFILFPLFVLILSPADYGILGLHGSLVSALMIFMAFGFEMAFNRFFFDYKRNPKLLRAYFSTTFLTIFGVGSVVCLLLLPMGEWLFKLTFSDPAYTFQPYGYYALSAGFIGALNGLVLFYFRNDQKPMRYFALAAGVFFFSTLFESIAVLGYKTDANGVLLARVGGMALYSIPFWIYILSVNGINYVVRFLKPAMQYGIPLIPYAILAFIYYQSDKILIFNSEDQGLKDVGLYNTAFTIAFIIELVIQSVQNATFPNIYELHKKDFKATLGEANMILRLIGLLTLFTIGLVLALSPVYMLNFTGDEYRGALFLIPFLLGGYIGRYLYITFSHPLFYFKKTSYTIWLNLIAAVVTIVGNLLLLPVLGIMGAAITMLISRLAPIPLTWFFVKKHTFYTFQMGYLKWSIPLLLAYLVILGLVPGDNLVLLYALYALPLAVFGAFVLVFVLSRSKSSNSLVADIKRRL